MNFSSLVLMEKDKDNKVFTKELGSYKVNEGAEYITKMYYDGEKVNVFFDTKKDVEEWEYTAIFDCFDYEAFAGKGYIIEDVDDEYNPTWVVKFDLISEHEDMEEKLDELCNIISEKIYEVFQAIDGKKESYQ
ncbi:DUF6762 family protein [Clostridium arbusti]|jgi:hypothetical protein|uniref:DUF6762 family protein n=1 Tax=Clostridium arbusti TaxID=1137848 RepID=UPI0002886859|nr:DUF6762 family protein [Clostridium arbusti]